MPADTFTSPGQVAILATAFVTLVTTLATLVYNFQRDGRRHEWEIEAARRHAEANAKGELERKEIADRVEKAEVVLNAKIDENTALSRQAFSEANNANEKLAAQSAAFDKLLAVAMLGAGKADGDSALHDVKTTVDTTATQVADIHHKVIDDA